MIVIRSCLRLTCVPSCNHAREPTMRLLNQGFVSQRAKLFRVSSSRGPGFFHILHWKCGRPGDNTNRVRKRLIVGSDTVVTPGKKKSRYPAF